MLMFHTGTKWDVVVTITNLNLILAIKPVRKGNENDGKSKSRPPR